MNKSLLVISKNYWGANLSEQTSLKFIEAFEKKLGISDIHKLIGNMVNINSVKQTISNWITEQMKKQNDKVYLFIYINGHGNQTTDNSKDEIDGMDELLQLPDGNLLDDELTEIINKSIKECLEKTQIIKPIVILISDHCSSGSMLDKRDDLVFDWITLGSSLDNQDSLMTGDGNVMTTMLIDVIQKQDENGLSFIELFDKLQDEMKNSFIGELQTPTLHYSDDKMKHINIFK